MMLRSSSTPVLGSLLQSFSDCPNNNSHHQSELHKHTKISCSCNSNGGGSQDFKKSLIHPSPSLADIKGGGGGFRRVQSDGNLEGLGDTCSYGVDEFNIPKRASRRTSLEAIPSFSANNLWTSFEDDDDDYEGIDEDEEEIGCGFDYNPMRAENMVFEKVAGNAIGYGSEGLGSQSEGKMYLASGIGVSGVDFTGRGGGGGGGGGRGSYRPVAFDKEGGGGVSMEEYYKRMLEENPGDPLFLRNYAEFLYKIKRDVGAAEEYYSRAILADQEDGETLSQYAKLIWEVHHDRDRAANYFERALQASSQSSHIHAAYANFLWDEEEEEEEEENAGAGSQAFMHQGVMASATA